jgi:hypothetical protein
MHGITAFQLATAIRANIELRLKLLMAHARYRGWIVEKKQVARALIDLGKASPEHMMGHVGQYLDELEPGERQAIQVRVSALKQRQARRKQLAPAVDVTAEPGE